MSRIYENGYSVEYPNELAYAGMPMLVRVADASDYIGAGITIKVGEDYLTETRTLYNGGATFDISRYAQMAFTGKSLGYSYDQATVHSELAQPIEVSVSLTDSKGAKNNIVSFKFKTLYGYIGIQQSNGGCIKRKWFAHLPQTFDIYLTEHSSVVLELDDGQTQEFTNNVRDDITQVAIKLPQPSANVHKATLAVSDTAYIDGDNIEYGNISYSLDIDRCTSGVYLRWLDHFGHWCYYLFRAKGRIYATKETRSWQDGILRNNLAHENGVFLQSGQTMHELSQQENISLGAKLVDADTFDFLLTLANSPIVEVLTNAGDYVANSATTPLWERVSVAGGSYARTGAPLQDFAVSIVRNSQTSQML